MATINDPNVAANIASVGEVASSPLHTTGKPIPADGHYRVNHRFLIANSQAAASRLFEVRNPSASKLVVLTRLVIKWINLGAHTAQIEDSLDCYKVTGFTVIDGTNVVVLVPSLKRTSMAADIAQARGVTAAGAAAGMTNGTLAKDGSSFAQMPRILNQAVMVITETQPRVADVMDALDIGEDTHPFVFTQNEGFVVENRVLLGAAAASSVYIDCSYAVVDAF